ncbi:MAG: CocE/NonD family hydrolase [Planctomycetes bacterium]|nr:CocE/NonD family hydrolase [Planctomycetota bacterium]MCW8134383.1 CocE/NonD family hydrolase [Planctomycetota bacterium]
MHRLLAMPLLFLFAGAIVAQDDAPAWKTEHRNVQIPMRDGKSLAANVLLPAKAGKYPCVLVQTPYNKDRMGREYGDNAGEAGRGSSKAWAQLDRQNYAWVFVDWRGFYGSKEAQQGVDRRNWKRGQDGYDCVEWCAKQEWCNGKVGTWGGSALGKQQFDTAAEGPPSLVCCVPLIAYQGQRYEAYFEGGVLLESHVKSLDTLGFGVGQAVKSARTPDKPVWRLARNNSYAPDKVKVPCLLISGWWDNYPRDVVQQLEDLPSRDCKLIMGPWSHTAIDVPEQGDLKFKDAEDYSTKVTMQFLDYYLRGIKDSGWEKQPRFHAYQCGEGWVTGESWARLRGKAQTWRLHADGAIATQLPGEATTENPLTREYTYDPRTASPTVGGQNLPPLTHGPKDVSAIAKRGDVLVYATPALESPLRTRGEIELHVPFACNRVDTDIHVRVCDTHSDGKSYLVGETILRAKWRDGKTAQPLKPGEVTELALKLPPHAYTWRKGHKLTLIVTGGNTPRYERNPHTGADEWDEKSARDATVTIHHNAKTGARLVLPVVE